MLLTWREQKSFYLVLVAILILHCSVMAIHFHEKSDKTTMPSLSSIKVKLIQEALDKVQSPNYKRQIVQSEDTDRMEKPQETAYLSDKDRSFERQTVSRNIDIFKKAALGDGTFTQKSSAQKTSAKKNNLNDLKLSDFGVEAGASVSKQVARSPASESVKGLQNGDPLSEGLSSTNDYVEEVTLGDFTHMNTVEYKFYGFFHRIRQKLEQFWGKSIQEKAENIFRAGRRLPASENLITSLQVTLNEKGEIIAVKIVGASGVKELDDAAIESFNQAGPFPNPPKELLVNGKATIDWGFVVKS